MYQIETGAIPSAHPSSKASGVFQPDPVGLFAAVIRRISDAVARRRDCRRAMQAHRDLSEMSDHLLRDIGIEPDGRERMSSMLDRPPF